MHPSAIAIPMPEPMSVLPSAAAGIWETLAIWLVGSALSLALELLIKPHGGRTTRTPAAWLIHLGLWSMAFGPLLLLTQRPIFAAMLVLVAALLVVLVNNAKFHALREPFLFSDFGLFSQAIRHPRLYLPFFGLGKALLAATAIGSSALFGLSVESALPESVGWGAFLALSAGMTAMGTTTLWVGTHLAPAPSLDPMRDLSDLGLTASLWLYWRLEQKTPCVKVAQLGDRRPTNGRGHEYPAVQLPHIVAVQSESFFDVRRLLDTVHPRILEHFDRIRTEAQLQGTLRVPAWGANTMRTEFGFLTAIASGELGVHRFNPYRRIARLPMDSLASELRSLGYHTVCIHPHPADFFGRDHVFPQLGFDTFIDIDGFDRRDTCGPYICDAAVTRKIEEQLEASEQPLFVFAITMENHGPLHLERVNEGDEPRYYTAPPPAGFNDLTVYLRHLANADRMLGNLTDALRKLSRDGLLCWFGDHVPSLPQVYASRNFDDSRTDYLIWRTDEKNSQHKELAIEQLAPILLESLQHRPPS